MTKTITIEIGRLVREIRAVRVEVPTDFDEQDENNILRLGAQVYDVEKDDNVSKWEPDLDWGCEQGTSHLLEDKTTPVQCIATVADNIEWIE
jgi:hypothetical protein